MRASTWSRLSAALIGLAVVTAIGVFAWSGLRGEWGLAAQAAALGRERALEAELAALRRERLAAENRVRRLTPGYLDLDLLDERARAVLGYVRPDEVVIRPVARPAGPR